MFILSPYGDYSLNKVKIVDTNIKCGYNEYKLCIVCFSAFRYYLRTFG